MKNVFPYVFTNNILAVELILAVDLKLLLARWVKRKFKNFLYFVRISLIVRIFLFCKNELQIDLDFNKGKKPLLENHIEVVVCLE